jgi:hypothetical protein
VRIGRDAHLALAAASQQDRAEEADGEELSHDSVRSIVKRSRAHEGHALGTRMQGPGRHRIENPA